jgi:hypothetical protein
MLEPFDAAAWTAKIMAHFEDLTNAHEAVRRAQAQILALGPLLLEPLGWLAGVDLVYWGDIDTHGFAILDRLRRRFPHARSMLMDRGTLLAHRSQWVTEPNPSAGRLDLLNAEASQLYHHLVADALGPSVRLEQERVSFAAIHQATLNS